MVYLYVIQSINAKFRYVGITNNLDKRLNQYNRGDTRSTRPHAPFRLLIEEHYEDYKKARQREVFLKSGVGRKYLDSL